MSLKQEHILTVKAEQPMAVIASPLLAALPEAARHTGDAPLCVDLDGTLICTDLLWEGLMLLARRAPLAALAMPLWVMRGKAQFKQEIATRVMPDPSLLPYRKDVLEFIAEQRKTGRRVILTTASHERWAQAVANHLGCFDDVIAGDATINMAGTNKLAAIQQRLEGAPFDYMGDSAADMPLWKAARRAYVVAPKGAAARRYAAMHDPDGRFGKSEGAGKAWIRALRPVQWSKNLLVFVPLLTSHKLRDLALVSRVTMAFAAFCLCASAVYLLNDLLDIESDRQHPRKRNRPLASAKLSIPAALGTCAMLITVSCAASAVLLPPAFTVTLLAYLAMTTLYSFWVKRKLLLDVIVLAGLYTLRIVAGGTATGVEISEYLLAFSMFMFVSLALLKRYTELLIMQDRFQRETKGRSYITDDLAMMESMGPAIGCMAVLVMALYIQYITHPSPTDAGLHPEYKHPMFLWAVCPVLLYWVMRVWVLAKRRHFADDPIAFALRDRVSIIAGMLAVAAVLLAAA